MMKHRSNIVANLHGHCHPGRGLAQGKIRDVVLKKVDNVPVINPGPFQWGRFCLVRLKVEDSSHRWKLLSTEFIDLSV